MHKIMAPRDGKQPIHDLLHPSEGLGSLVKNVSNNMT